MLEIIARKDPTAIRKTKLLLRLQGVIHFGRTVSHGNAVVFN